MIDSQQLKQLITIHDCGTFSAAAQQLHISQPALSRSMKRLEEDLTLELFDHARNKAQMNALGTLLVERGRRIIDELEDLPHTLKSYAHSLQTISIGSCSPAVMWHLADELCELFPEMSVSSELTEHVHLVDGLLENAYQLVIVDQPIYQEGILCRKHASESVYLSVPPDHPLAAREGIHMSELNGLTMLVFTDLGRWRWLTDKAVGVHFIMQKEWSVFTELVNASSLPCFVSSMTRIFNSSPVNRVAVPILDDEASVVYYLCARESSRPLLDRVSPLSGAR